MGGPVGWTSKASVVGADRIEGSRVTERVARATDEDARG